MRLNHAAQARGRRGVGEWGSGGQGEKFLFITYYLLLITYYSNPPADTCAS